MSARRKICVVTGTRADYGLLYWVMKGIQDDPELDLQVIVTGMHLSQDFGLTYKFIEEDGFTIDYKIDMQLSGDTAAAVTRSMGLAVIGFAEAYQELGPDLVVVLGDRYEILAAAEAALIAKIPVAHIAGGDITEGAFDDAIRHSITKMAHLHFVTNQDSGLRVKQLGENPEHIFNVGSPGLDYINRVELVSRGEVENRLDYSFRNKNILVTFHPATLDSVPPEQQVEQLLAALDSLGSDTGIIFTGSNADPEGRLIIQKIEEFVSLHPHARYYTSLGQTLYLSCMAHFDVVVGNSSSGLYEAPSFKKPTVNIGSRQRGRLKAESVIDCEPRHDLIIQAIRLAFEKDCSQTVNLYGDGNSAPKIVAIIKEYGDFKGLLQKKFVEIG
ncbi:MAG: UDP-N-acetylglucosamine 2-epimerase [Acidobacteriota bacterium]